MTSTPESNIIDSWKENAAPWITAIQREEIRSRVTVTNDAILNQILSKKPGNVLDVGCGEGWLSRALGKEGIEVLGIDVVPQLISEAKKQGGAEFRVLPYDQVSAETIKARFDVIVCNFSLIGKESVTKLFTNIPGLLTENGYFVVQTMHPLGDYEGHTYQDGWRPGSWGGFSSTFTNPAPWYFRTVETWEDLFRASGLRLEKTIDNRHPESEALVSVIFTGRARMG